MYGNRKFIFAQDVFTNIIDNAIKHSVGPLTVNIRLNRTHTDSRDYCQVTIDDNGPGLPDEMKKKLSREIASSEIKARSQGARAVPGQDAREPARGKNAD